jgi:hypothetical protein
MLPTEYYSVHHSKLNPYSVSVAAKTMTFSRSAIVNLITCSSTASCKGIAGIQPPYCIAVTSLGLLLPVHLTRYLNDYPSGLK